MRARELDLRPPTVCARHAVSYCCWWTGPIVMRVGCSVSNGKTLLCAEASYGEICPIDVA